MMVGGRDQDPEAGSWREGAHSWHRKDRGRVPLDTKRLKNTGEEKPGKGEPSNRRQLRIRALQMRGVSFP